MILVFLSPATNISAAQWKVIRVYDGDTLTVKGTDVEVGVRLAATDAPEMEGVRMRKGQPFSREAKAHLERILLNKTVEIHEHGTDQSGLILGEVFLDGKNLNLEMVRMGLAEVFDWEADRGPDFQVYLDAEANAQEEKIGIWSLRSG
jgi:micrococcal nuclease